MKQKIIFFLLLILAGQGLIYAQTGDTKKTIDSLKKVINESENDSIKINALVAWDQLIYLEAPDLDLELNQRIEEIALRNLTANSNSSLSLYFADELAHAVNIQGIQYEFMGKISLALECYKKSLSIHEKTKSKKGIANAYNNIGNIYRTLYRYDDALKYYKLSLQLRQEIEDFNGVAYAKNNIANIYHSQEKYLDALQYFEQSLKLFEDLNFDEGRALVNQNIGSVYISLGNFALAQYYFDISLKLNKELLNYQGLIDGYNLIADVLISKAKVEPNHLKATKLYKDAILYADSASTYANQYEFNSQIQSAYYNSYSAYSALNNYEKALEYHIKFFEIYDLSIQLENEEEINRNEFALKSSQDSIRTVESEKLYQLELQSKNEKIGHDKTIKLILYIGLVLLIIFGVVIYNRFKVSQKQKLFIEKQKAEVERTHVELAHKNSEILDSINYAKRIQSAILPPKDYLTNLEIENFILYEPKDIVAGDFYWIEKNGKNLFIAVADCTGHGVPGALVSVVCHNALNRAVREYKLTIPGEILDKTKEIIIEEFAKSDQVVKDGMDISLCLIKDGKLFYSGAHNPLWMARNKSKLDEIEIIELKADKQPVGQFEHSKPFTTHELNLVKGDIIYLFSDGYVDQFGGPKGKKFKSKSFKKLLLDINKLSFDDQKTSLKNEFENWKGNLEQVDDVCIIGFRLS